LAVRSNESVVIAGTFYGYRQALTTELIRHGVEVGLYGGRLPAWVDPKIRHRHTGRFVEREEKSRVFGEALACLNSTAMSEGNSLNCRAFEIAGAGGLQLLEQREIVNECFEPGKELLVFDSIPELMDLISRAKVDRAWASGIREAGACRALAQHTYKHRLEVIFRSLAGGRAVA
jgi:spore maturation protein CgeB